MDIAGRGRPFSPLVSKCVPMRPWKLLSAAIEHTTSSEVNRCMLFFFFFLPEVHPHHILKYVFLVYLFICYNVFFIYINVLKSIHFIYLLWKLLSFIFTVVKCVFSFWSETAFFFLVILFNVFVYMCLHLSRNTCKIFFFSFRRIQIVSCTVVPVTLPIKILSLLNVLYWTNKKVEKN